MSAARPTYDELLQLARWAVANCPGLALDEACSKPLATVVVKPSEHEPLDAVLPLMTYAGFGDISQRAIYQPNRVTLQLLLFRVLIELDKAWLPPDPDQEPDNYEDYRVAREDLWLAALGDPVAGLKTARDVGVLTAGLDYEVPHEEMDAAFRCDHAGQGARYDIEAAACRCNQCGELL